MKSKRSGKKCFFLLVLVVFVCSFKCTETKAAFWGGEDYFGWHSEMPSASMAWQEPEYVQVERGQSFYVGDFVCYNKLIETKEGDDEWGPEYVYKYYTASMLNAKYKSSNKSVATVNAKGYFRARKKGETTISVSYNRQTIKMTFRVVGKGKLTKGTTVKSRARAITQNPLKVPKRITEGNGIELSRKNFDYQQDVSDDTFDGYISKMGFYGDYSNGVSNKLVAPQAARYYTLDCMLDQYALKYNPEDLKSKEPFKVKKIQVDAQRDKVIITLEKPVTKRQYIALAARGYYHAGSNPWAECYGVYDKTSKKYYSQVSGEVRLGSDKIVMEVEDMVPAPPSAPYDLQIVDVDVKEGHLYQIGKKTEWTKGKKVRAKNYSYSIYEED